MFVQQRNRATGEMEWIVANLQDAGKASLDGQLRFQKSWEVLQPNPPRASRFSVAPEH